MTKIFKIGESKNEQAIKDAALTQVTLNAEQTGKLNKLADSVRQDWVKSNSKSFDAQALYSFTESLFIK